MKYAAFLRGINVGGKNKIQMKALRELLSNECGFENVKTYINSGNVIFETSREVNERLAEKIERAIEKEFALKIKVMARSIAEIEEIVGNNPFDGQFENEKDLHVLFLEKELPEDKRAALLAKNSENEKFHVRNREIYCLLRAGVSDSLLGKDYIGKKLKVTATARNWRTVNKVLEF